MIYIHILRVRFGFVSAGLVAEPGNDTMIPITQSEKLWEAVHLKASRSCRFSHSLVLSDMSCSFCVLSLPFQSFLTYLFVRAIVQCNASRVTKSHAASSHTMHRKREEEWHALFPTRLQFRLWVWVILKVSTGLQPTSDGLQPTSDGLQTTSNGLQPTSDGLQPTSDGLQPTSDGLQPY